MRLAALIAVFISLTLTPFGHTAADAQQLPQNQQKAPAADSATQDVQAAAAAFVENFNNLDWEKFRLSFTDDATVFFPFPQFPRRATGRAEVEAIFKRFFDEARKRKAAPPYLNIEPKDLQIQALGDAAIVTFHLGDDENVGRRTLVFHRQKGRWLIAHLHASSLTRPKPAQGQ
jgi:ketosteroid isomerase-like protein